MPRAICHTEMDYGRCASLRLLPRFGESILSSETTMRRRHTTKADRFGMRPRLQVALASLALLLLAAGVAAQQAPKPSPYPEHGQVIPARLGAEAVGSAGIVGSLKRWIY